MKMKTVALVVALVCTASAARADTTVFSLAAWIDRDGIGYNPAGSSPGTYFSNVASNVTINSISVLNQMNSDGDLRFVIFDHATSTLLYESGPKSFSSSERMTWKTSDAFSFTLLSGHQYDIGAVSNVQTNWAYFCCSPPSVQNGLTAYPANANFSGFDNPTSIGSGGVLVPIKLTAPVPEPETYALMMAGLGVLGAVARRKSQKAA